MSNVYTKYLKYIFYVDESILETVFLLSYTMVV